MNIERLQEMCMRQPHACEDIKWESELCFCVGEKIFVMTALEGAFRASFKVTPEQYDELIQRHKISPAPYLARNKWVLVEDPDSLSSEEWQKFIEQAYIMAYTKLPAKVRRELENPSDS